ncbi:HAD family hydrolase [Heyndrickxia sporothermodurans]|uniref:Uncharacterized protein n=1 Tax=Heyndrickxia sporothermodurans TaxID=46224 RepID=A0A150LCC6_9BACI|nr:hypothetical protein B4102_2414 [Heyndrickxia sporothermodurans]PTY77938.1 HAD family hydrolase [Heyndrickxia sporothermodurans]
MIKAIIFDFDGLILDTETIWYESYKETMKSYKCDLPLEQFSKCIGSDDTALYAYFKEQLGDDCDIQEIEDAAKTFYEKKMTAPVARAGVKEYLEDAKKLGYKISLATSSSKMWVTNYLSQLNLLHYFDILITKDDVDKVKPAPDLYLKAVDSLNINPSEAIAFEDSLNGLQAALAAGLKCVIVPNPVTEHLAFENHHLRLQSMADMSLSEVIRKVE